MFQIEDGALTIYSSGRQCQKGEGYLQLSYGSLAGRLLGTRRREAQQTAHAKRRSALQRLAA